MIDGELLLVATPPPRNENKWERLARRRVRELSRLGLLPPAAAGYGDALRMAGRNLDHAEAVGTPRERVSASEAWSRCVGYLLPPPVEAAAGDGQDPWEELRASLRDATRLGSR